MAFATQGRSKSQLSAKQPGELFCGATPPQPTEEIPRGLPKKRGLIISIKNYKPKVGPLRWVHDDANEMRDLLCGPSLGFQPDDVTVMMDLPGVASHLQPTYLNIMRQLGLFLKEQKPGDVFFLMYVGHAFHQRNPDGTEEDDEDEYLISLDEEKILDDILFDLLVRPLLPGSKLIAVMDTCHSGTLLDLPHYRCNRVSNWTSSIRRTIRSVLERLPSWLFREDELYVPPATSPRGEAIHISGSPSTQGAAAPVKRPIKFCSGFCRRRPAQEPEEPFALCFSACKDPQQTYEGPKRQSMSQAFVRALADSPKPVLKDLMRAINASVKTAEQGRLRALRKEMKAERGQKQQKASVRAKSIASMAEAQLSSLRPLDMSTHLPL